MSATVIFSKKSEHELSRKAGLSVKTLKTLHHLFIGSRLYNLAELTGIVDESLGNVEFLIIRRGADLLADADTLLTELASPTVPSEQLALLKEQLTCHLGEHFPHLHVKTDLSTKAIYFQQARSLNTIGLVRLGDTRTFHLQWFRDNKPVGTRVTLPPGLRHGDICLFSDMSATGSFELYYSLEVIEDMRKRKRVPPTPAVIVKKA